MSKIQNSKHYDLEERTYRFAKRCRDFVGRLPKTIANIEYGSQLIRSSGSTEQIILKPMRLLVKEISPIG